MPKVGGTKTVNLKKIRALAPTHVIVNVDENRKETADALAEFVPNVLITHPLAPLDNLALYRQIGGAFGKEPEAEALCASFSSAFASVSKKSYQERSVLYLIWRDPWMTVSRDTYISRMLALFGMLTAPERSTARYPRLPGLDLQGVDTILLSSEPYRFRESDQRRIESETGKPVRLIDGQMTSWYGPRAIEGLRYLSAFARRLQRELP